mmetsp:Transcript_34087/g.78763  ORF Transcript_34087/g.78763 Transcript_34087/m.78763 type:complete len:217 (-) Transcript_34087:318-968(-)
MWVANNLRTRSKGECVLSVAPLSQAGQRRRAPKKHTRVHGARTQLYGKPPYVSIAVSVPAAASAREAVLKSSRRISGVIWWWNCALKSVFNRSFCSRLTSALYRCANTSSDWCQSTGSSGPSPRSQKWSTSASMTRCGRAYFLFSRTRMKRDVGPAYGISASLSSATAEWFAGIETLASTEAMMVASFRLQPVCAMGSTMPLKNAAGLYTAFFTAI